MLCYAIYPTLLPQLQREWGAGNSAAGLIAGIRCSAGRGRGQRQSGRPHAAARQAHPGGAVYHDACHERTIRTRICNQGGRL